MVSNKVRERGLVSYSADVDLPLADQVRVGEVWHLKPEDGKTLQKAVLSLHSNGMRIICEESRQVALSVAWSPFSLVQACRLHTIQADAALPWLRLFKVSVFHHGATHFFATKGEKADAARARWVADVSRTLRLLTQSLFPDFTIRCTPLPGAGWTAMRLLAGYLLLCDDQGVSVVYCELHAHWDTTAGFVAYEDEFCDVEVLCLNIDMQTCVSERVGVDCSCFSLGGHHFSTRTCSEKMLWLRAISNVKVKLRHQAANPTPTDLRHYRAAIAEYSRALPKPEITSAVGSYLPRRVRRRNDCTSHGVPLDGGVGVPLDGGVPNMVAATRLREMPTRNPGRPFDEFENSVCNADMPPPPPSGPPDPKAGGSVGCEAAAPSSVDDLGCDNASQATSGTQVFFERTTSTSTSNSERHMQRPTKEGIPQQSNGLHGAAADNAESPSSTPNLKSVQSPVTSRPHQTEALQTPVGTSTERKENAQISDCKQSTAVRRTSSAPRRRIKSREFKRQSSSRSV